MSAGQAPAAVRCGMAKLDNDGETVEIKGSGAKPYVLKNVGGVLSCSCPAWRMFGGPIDRRTCKHLRLVQGEASETARIAAVREEVVSPIPMDGHELDHDFGPRKLQERDEVVGGSKKTSFGCACEGGSHCDVAHDPAACGCRQCVTAEEGAKVGRKLRQDEKAKLFGPPVLLANSFEDHEDSLDVRDWWMSEKLDGVRAYFNGKDFISRQGNVYPAPDFFKAGLPDFPLDGELWMGRKMFQKTISIVKSAGAGDRWKDITYVVFDQPTHSGKFEDRMTFLLELEANIRAPYMKVLRQEQVHHLNHLLSRMEEVVAQGGEGMMIREPGSAYVVGRSSTCLKIKPFKDAEATVIGHKPGKKQFKGMTGSLEVRMPDGKTFDVGSGMSHEDRRNPPKVGSVITYRYTETTDGGIPKCASFVAVRDFE